MKFIKNNLYLD